jgi:asparagine synthase (glutamine-hydrolysing)
VELILGLSEEQKIPGGRLKYLLKRCVRGLIPNSVIDRRKQGFGVPITEWFLGTLGAQVRETLATFCESTDFFDRDAVLRLFDEDRDPRLWYLFNFALWWNSYIDGHAVSEYPSTVLRKSAR